MDIGLQLKSKTNKKMSRESFGYFTVHKYNYSKSRLLHGGKFHRRRRIKIEENAKVVLAVWGTEFIQVLAALD